MKMPPLSRSVRLFAFAATTFVFSAASPAMACTSEPVSGNSCSTLGETCMASGGDGIFACLNQTANGHNGQWRSMTGGSVSAASYAVMAFESQVCPDGWTPYTELAGRTIIGAGSGAGLTTHAVDDVGGEEKHSLSLDEMPSHNHDVGFSYDGGSGNWRHYEFPVSSYPGWPTFYTGSGYRGGNVPHNVMMPWRALLYCKKAY